jgi:hypothetical protein
MRSTVGPDLEEGNADPARSGTIRHDPARFSSICPLFLSGREGAAAAFAISTLHLVNLELRAVSRDPHGCDQALIDPTVQRSPADPEDPHHFAGAVPRLEVIELRGS